MTQIKLIMPMTFYLLRTTNSTYFTYKHINVIVTILLSQQSVV